MGSVGSVSLSGCLLAATVGMAGAVCQPDAVELRGPSGVQRFHVEVALTPAQQAQGLMNREKMAVASGMLFVFDPPKHARFWMKNTLIPLDMIFADKAGRVTVVQPNAVPLDKSPVDGGEGVAFVLEINGGLAERMGIGPGTELRHPLVDQTGAAWACDAP